MGKDRTPGPWQFIRWAGDGSEVWCQETDEVVARVEDGPDELGNTMLIAAAPDMLEVLKHCVFALDTAIMLRGYNELIPYAESARAVIVKVEGE